MSWGWLNNVSDLILSVGTHAEYILTTMNEELLAAGVLIVQGGALLVIHKWFYQLFAINCPVLKGLSHEMDFDNVDEN